MQFKNHLTAQQTTLELSRSSSNVRVMGQGST